jgi:hypothetical protein
VECLPAATISARVRPAAAQFRVDLLRIVNCRIITVLYRNHLSPELDEPAASIPIWAEIVLISGAVLLLTLNII